VHDGAVPPSPDGGRRAVGMSGDGANGVVAPGLVTAHLVLAPVADDDIEELFALHADPRAFAEDLTDPLTERAQMRWVLTQWRQSWERHGIGYWSVRARDGSALPAGLLGVVGLSPLESEGGTRLSAYWRLRPEATGRGVATEALRAVLEDPHRGPGGREVLAVTAAGNTPSRALAARLGFAPAPRGRAVPGGRVGDVLLVRPGRPAARAPG
jgi:RimJ/RimL family protein N-acetyltransferase